MPNVLFKNSIIEEINNQKINNIKRPISQPIIIIIIKNY